MGQGSQTIRNQRVFRVVRRNETVLSCRVQSAVRKAGGVLRRSVHSRKDCWMGVLEERKLLAH